MNVFRPESGTLSDRLFLHSLGKAMDPYKGSSNICIILWQTPETLLKSLAYIVETLLKMRI